MVHTVSMSAATPSIAYLLHVRCCAQCFTHVAYFDPRFGSSQQVLSSICRPYRAYLVSQDFNLILLNASIFMFSHCIPLPRAIFQVSCKSIVTHSHHPEHKFQNPEINQVVKDKYHVISPVSGT